MIVLILAGLTLILAVLLLALIPRMIIGPMLEGPVSYNRLYDPADYGLEADLLRLQSRDGLSLEAYAVRHPQPRGALVFLTGIHNPSVTAFYGHAAMLHVEGWTSLLLEVRAHGRSEGKLISLGGPEIMDVQAAVDYLDSQPELADKALIVFGLSMGGAVAVNAAAHIPRLDGLVALSAYSSFTDAFIDNMKAGGFPRFLLPLQRPFVNAYLSRRLGREYAGITPLNSMARLGSKPALLMHSREDSQVPFASFERLLRAAPAGTRSWVVEGDNHFILPGEGFLQPADFPEYRAVLLKFLESCIKSGM